MKAFVYKWTDTKTNKVYIGYHKGCIDDGYISSGKYFLQEFNKRKNDFVREILFVGNLKDCYEKEQQLIKQLFIEKTPTYNKGVGGTWNYDCEVVNKMRNFGEKNGNWNKIFSEEHRKKISNSMIGHKRNVGKNNPMFGKKQTEKHRIAMAKMSKPIITDLGIFATQNTAGIYHGVSQTTIHKWLKNGKAQYA